MSTVELTRETDGPGLVEALAEHGLAAELVGDEHLAVQVEDCDEELLAHAIEDWIAGARPAARAAARSTTARSRSVAPAG